MHSKDDGKAIGKPKLRSHACRYQAISCLWIPLRLQEYSLVRLEDGSFDRDLRLKRGEPEDGDKAA
jgi:hypothetical protein